jgi:antitoxin component of MazEF toxin-antitoxin module
VLVREQKTVSSIFKTGSGSSTLIIPKQLAKQSGLDEPCHVVIESTQNGILIKKLDLDDVK